MSPETLPRSRASGSELRRASVASIRSRSGEEWRGHFNWTGLCQRTGCTGPKSPLQLPTDQVSWLKWRRCLVSVLFFFSFSFGAVLKRIKPQSVDSGGSGTQVSFHSYIHKIAPGPETVLLLGQNEWIQKASLLKKYKVLCNKSAMCTIWIFNHKWHNFNEQIK